MSTIKNEIKKFKDVGITPIKCTEKTGTEELKKLHIKANDILYRYSFRPILYDIIVLVKGKIVSVGKEIKALDVPNSALAKKEEILKKLRIQLSALIKLESEYRCIDEDANKAAEALQKYKVAQYIKVKYSMSQEEMLKELEDNKELYEALKENYAILPSFEQMQKELLENFSSRYIF